MANMSAVGKKNKTNGALFERWVSNSCETYFEDGEAFIEKTPEPFHITSKEKNNIVCGYYEKKGQPDYKGILAGGKGIMFEAKHTDTDQIRQSAVTDEQEKSLNAYHKLGAICFVLVSMGFESFYRVPWTVWENMKDLFGHKHMTLDDLASYRVHATINKIEFLSGIKEFADKYSRQEKEDN